MRELTIQWIGPFLYQNAYYIERSGLYMVYVGQNPIFVNGSTDLARSLAEHAVFGRERAMPKDIVGRELFDYSRRYNLRLTLKLGKVSEKGTRVEDKLTLTDVASLLVASYRFPCNPYGREVYEGRQALTIINRGKTYPLEDRYEGWPRGTAPE